MSKSIVVSLFIVVFSSISLADDPPGLALVYTDADINTPSACETAIANLGWSALIINDDTAAFNDQFYPYSNWDIVVVECFDGDALCEIIDSLNGFICGDYGSGNNGLKSVMFTSALDNCSNADFWANLGIVYETDITESFDVFVWSSYEIFCEPNALSGPFAVDYDGSNDKGDKVSTTSGIMYSGAYEIAGATETDTLGEGVICYQDQDYNFEDPPTPWWGPHVVGTMNTDFMTDQVVAAQLWENALHNVWYCDYACSIKSASLGEIKAVYK